MGGYLVDLLPYDLLLPAGIFILWLVQRNARHNDVDLAVASWKRVLTNGLGFGGVALFGYGLGYVWPPPVDEFWYQPVALAMLGTLLMVWSIWLSWHWRLKSDRVGADKRPEDSIC